MAPPILRGPTLWNGTMSDSEGTERVPVIELKGISKTFGEVR